MVTSLSASGQRFSVEGEGYLPNGRVFADDGGEVVCHQRKHGDAHGAHHGSTGVAACEPGDEACLCSKVDPPDPNGTDENGDGIDGLAGCSPNRASLPRVPVATPLHSTLK